MRRVSIVVSFLLWGLIAPTAAHAGWQELVVSPSPGFAVRQVDGQVRYGGGFFLDIDYGLSDSLGIRANAEWNGLATPGRGNGVINEGSVGFGGYYHFDHFQAIPFAGLTVGASLMGGGGLGLRANFQAQLSVGVDVLIRRDFSLGFELRYQLLAPDIARFPYFFGLSVRMTYRRQ